MRGVEGEVDEGGRTGEGGRRGKGGKGLKPHQVHELAEAKIVESERLRRALGIKVGREGRAWDRDRGGAVKEESKEEEEERGNGERRRDGRGRDSRR